METSLSVSSGLTSLFLLSYPGKARNLRRQNLFLSDIRSKESCTAVFIYQIASDPSPDPSSSRRRKEKSNTLFGRLGIAIHRLASSNLLIQVQGFNQSRQRSPGIVRLELKIEEFEDTIPLYKNFREESELFVL
jgi:hypothetical protein